jgi:diguanylate cyclase (GGDEF)-like protein/PAS domain S-box-containing protein
MNDQDKQIERLQRRLAREKKARAEAEDILSAKSQELYEKSVETEESKRLLEMALWASGESIWSWQKSNDSFHFRQYENHATQVEESVVSYDDFAKSVHPDDLDNLTLNWSLHKMGFSTIVDGAYRIKKGNSYAWLRFKGRVIAFDDDAAQSIVGTLKDVTDLVEAEASSKLMSYAFSRSTDPMLIINKSLRLLEANQAFCKISDLSDKTIGRYSLSKFIKFSRQELEELRQDESLSIETKLHLGDNTIIDVDVKISEFKSNESASDYYVVALRDLTDKKKSERKLYQLAHFDPLTNLLNRTSLRLRFDRLVNSCEQLEFSMVFVELEGLKDVNDRWGHEACDLLISHQAEAFSAMLGEDSHLCRWGSEEFVYILPHAEENLLLENGEEIITCVNNMNFEVEGQKIPVSCSVGVAIYPQNGKQFDEIMRAADLAMFNAKSRGKNQIQIFYQGITDEAIKKLNMLNELREAVASESLNFVLQGKYNEQRQLIGAELLCRWQSPSFGNVSPGVFIPMIEQHGLESALGLLAVKQAAIFGNVLATYGVNIPISVNISSPQILDPAFLSQITSICATHNAAHELIELEITESVFMLEDESPTARLREIQNAGFRISLDDFGTGYSSLSYLRQFQFDVVKIDRSFILDLENSERAYNLFVAIMDMCKALRTDTVVEGIETERQFELLSKVGVNKYQGFLLGRPILLDDFVKDNMH